MAETPQTGTSPREDAEGDPGSTSSQVLGWLLELLACPVDLAAVVVAGETLRCRHCGRLYPIRDGIPVMIPTEAESEQKF